MTLFFVVILINVNIHQSKFFTAGNVFWCLIGAAIIWGHFYFDVHYQRHYRDQFIKMPIMIWFFIENSIFKIVAGLSLLFLLYHL